MDKIKEIIVVEGKDDTKRVRAALSCDTLETRGSALDGEILEQIKKAQVTRGVIVFTDPDFSGEKIRKTISAEVPGVKHAFLRVEQAVPKGQGSLGVEHASFEDIREAIQHAHPEILNQGSQISKELLLDAGLIGGAGSRKRRERLGELLNIGYTNGKQLQHRLQMFQITEESFITAIKQILEEENA